MRFNCIIAMQSIRSHIVLLLLTTAFSSPAQSTFTASLDADQVTPPFGVEGDPSGSPFIGSGTFEYTPSDQGASPTLSYRIVLPGMDLDGSLTPAVLSDDVTAIHIHFGAFGQNGPHGLNILGFSGGQIREDDADMQIDVANSVVTGLWDDSDMMFTGTGGTRQPFDSVAMTDAVDALIAGELYVQVHTLNFPNGELRGQITVVPEPSSMQLGLMALTGCLAMGIARRRRRQSPAAVK